MSCVSTKFLKAKKGDFFYESLAARNQEPKLLRFVSVQTVPVNGGFSSADRVLFTIVKTGEHLIIDADDRYGYYPPLSAKNLEKIETRIADLTRELETYEHLQEQIDSYVNKTTGV